MADICIFAGQGAQVPGMGKDFAQDPEIMNMFVLPVSLTARICSLSSSVIMGCWFAFVFMSFLSWINDCIVNSVSL